MARTIPTCRALLLAAAGIAGVAAVPAAASAPDLLAYMQAQAADGDGRVAFAARRYAAALAATPDDRIVAERTYREAVEAGDLALADRAIAALGAQAPADAALLTLARAARAGDHAAADTAIARIAGSQLGLLAAPLRAWGAVERGADPSPVLAGPRADPVSRRFAEETRAMVLIARGRTTEGLAALRPLLRNDQPAEDLRIAAARLLLGAGKRDAALTLLGGDAPPVVAMRTAPASEGVKPSLAFGASLLFTRIASDLALGPAGPLSVTLAQAALRADPANGRARVLLAAALAKNGAYDRALAVLAEMSPANPYAGIAARGRLGILDQAGREEEALALAKAAATGDDATAADMQRYGDMLLAAERPKEAAAVYKRLLDRPGDADEWLRWMQYGGALDEAGDWRRAEPALARAVELAPGQAVALNYLAYARLAHGAPAGEALALLEKASRLAPEDAAITDSLGWAYHLDGASARAVPLLEKAAAAAPDNAEIGEHLGDAYWDIGRRYEARYAWRAAQAVADAKDVARLAGKIADGPPARR